LFGGVEMRVEKMIFDDDYTLRAKFPSYANVGYHLGG